MSTRDYLIEQYLDYRNNYLSMETFADHNGMTLNQAEVLIALGRDLLNTPNIHA